MADEVIVEVLNDPIETLPQEQRTKIKADLFKDLLLERVYEERHKLVTALITNAINGKDAALKEILERALGKVKEDFNINAKVENSFSLSDEQFNRIIATRAKRLSSRE